MNCPYITKEAYRTREIAERVAAKRMNKEGVKLRVYKCPTCPHFHLTSH